MTRDRLVRRARICGLLLTAASLAWAQPAGATTAPPAPSAASRPPFSLVRCESFRLRPVKCPAITNANVRLAQVLGGRCLAGLTWFYDRRAIHVRGGCRAVFIVGGPSLTPSFQR